MPTWVWVVVVVVAVLAVGAFRERRRASGLEAWSRARGFLVHSPFTPGDRPPMAALAARFNVRGARRWAVGVEGAFDGVAVTVAEFEATPPAKKTGIWYTLVAWPTDQRQGPLVLWPGQRGAVDRAMDALTGRSEAGAAGTRMATGGGLVVEGDPELRAAWLTDTRRQALESWPHGGAFVIDDGHAAWRTEGLLTPDRLEGLLAQLPAARRNLE